MKVEIEVDDIATLAKALNNACISFNEVVSGIGLCCAIPRKLEPLKKVPQEELDARVRCLVDVCRQIEVVERKSAINKVSKVVR